jgi:hypothetical protein
MTFSKLFQRSVSALTEKGKKCFFSLQSLRGQYAARELLVDQASFTQTRLPTVK